MSASKKWRWELEHRFGIDPELCSQLAPVLERIAMQELTAEESEALLKGVADVLQSARGRDEDRPEGEVRALLGEFLSEIKKVDESVKVLSVYLERLNQRVEPAKSVRVLH